MVLLISTPSPEPYTWIPIAAFVVSIVSASFSFFSVWFSRSVWKYNLDREAKKKRLCHQTHMLIIVYRNIFHVLNVAYSDDEKDVSEARKKCFIRRHKDFMHFMGKVLQDITELELIPTAMFLSSFHGAHRNVEVPSLVAYQTLETVLHNQLFIVKSYFTEPEFKFVTERPSSEEAEAFIDIHFPNDMLVNIPTVGILRRSLNKCFPFLKRRTLKNIRREAIKKHTRRS